MSELIEMYTSVLTENEVLEQDEKTIKILKTFLLIGLTTSIFIILLPYASHAKEAIKIPKKEELIEYGDKTFRKLYNQKDYRPIKQNIKMKVKEVVKRKVSPIKANVEFTLFEIDLNPIQLIELPIEKRLTFLTSFLTTIQK